MFIASKTFYILEILLTLPGLCILYGCIGVVGYAIENIAFYSFKFMNRFCVCFQNCRFIGMYLTLPETEGRTLEDVENYFADRKRRFNDIHIPNKEEVAPNC